MYPYIRMPHQALVKYRIYVCMDTYITRIYFFVLRLIGASYIYMYSCTYIYKCLYISAYIHTCMKTYMHMRLQWGEIYSRDVCIHTYVYSYTYINIYKNTYIYIRHWQGEVTWYIYPYIPTFKHTHKYIYRHIYISDPYEAKYRVICILKYIHSYTHKYMRTYIHRYIYTYQAPTRRSIMTYVCIHTYFHTHTQI